MTQKVLKVGSSAAVTIPKKSLEELGLKIGDQVEVIVEKSKKKFSIQPITKIGVADRKIAKLTLDFVNRYRKDMEALSRYRS
jgi:antitoxin component of MazEF toxin-antitoxin module